MNEKGYVAVVLKVSNRKYSKKENVLQAQYKHERTCVCVSVNTIYFQSKTSRHLQLIDLLLFF